VTYWRLLSVRILQLQDDKLKSEKVEVKRKLEALQDALSRTKVQLTSIQTKEVELQQNLSLARRQAEERQRLLVILQSRLSVDKANLQTLQASQPSTNSHQLNGSPASNDEYVDLHTDQVHFFICLYKI